METKKLKPHKENKKFGTWVAGFTLIEMLIAVAIGMIITSFAAYNYNKMKIVSAEKAAQAHGSQVIQTVTSYLATFLQENVVSLTKTKLGALPSANWTDFPGSNPNLTNAKGCANSFAINNDSKFSWMKPASNNVKCVIGIGPDQRLYVYTWAVGSDKYFINGIPSNSLATQLNTTSGGTTSGGTTSGGTTSGGTLPPGNAYSPCAVLDDPNACGDVRFQFQ